MRRWRAFTAVCAELRAGLLNDRSVGNPPQVSWEMLIDCSSRHNVTPALSFCLKEKGDLPTEVRKYFDTILSLNRTRNDCIVDGLSRVVTALNAIEIEPVLLKGMSHLVEGLYPALAVRVIGDIDLLVPEGRAKEAAAALRGSISRFQSMICRKPIFIYR